jgi:hypothetical protein
VKHIRGSVWIIIAGLVLAIAGGITLAVQSSPAALSTDRAEVPNPVEFVSQGGEYRLALLSQPSGGDVTALDCTVYLADATTIPVSIGDTFTAPAGISIATCEMSDGRDPANYVYGIGPATPTIAIAAIVALAVGLLTAGVGAILLIVGRRTGTGKRVAQ